MSYFDVKTRKTNYNKISRRVSSGFYSESEILQALENLCLETSLQAETRPEVGLNVTVEQYDGKLVLRSYLRKDKIDLKAPVTLLRGVSLPLKLLPNIIPYLLLLVPRGVLILGLVPANKLYFSIFKKNLDLSELEEAVKKQTAILEEAVSVQEKVTEVFPVKTRKPRAKAVVVTPETPVLEA